MNNLNFNPWHNVEIGNEAPDIVQAVIEIEQGTKGKYELDKTSGLLRLDRVLFSTVHYPANNEGDDKIIAVAADDISMAHYKHITELPDYFQMELKQFFEDYKKLEKKAVAVEEFQDEKIAFEIINRAIESYKEEFAERG